GQRTEPAAQGGRASGAAPDACHEPPTGDGNGTCTPGAAIAGCCLGDADCDDGDACTTDACVGNACVHDPVFCDDGNECTADSCDPAVGCRFVPQPGQQCSGGTGTCDTGGICVPNPLCTPAPTCATDA